MLEPFKADIHRLLKDDPKLPGVRVRELLEPLGCTAGKTIVMTTCAKSGRCSRRRPARSTGRSTGRRIAASSTSGSRGAGPGSLDPAMVGRRVEVCADKRRVRAIVLDTGEVACAHSRSFARQRTITVLA